MQGYNFMTRRWDWKERREERYASLISLWNLLKLTPEPEALLFLHKCPCLSDLNKTAPKSFCLTNVSTCLPTDSAWHYGSGHHLLNAFGRYHNPAKDPEVVLKFPVNLPHQPGHEIFQQLVPTHCTHWRDRLQFLVLFACLFDPNDSEAHLAALLQILRPVAQKFLIGPKF